MTTLDPTHVPGFERTSDPTTGQAVKTSISAIHSDRVSPTSASQPGAAEDQPSWRGAWKRRQEARLAKEQEREAHRSDDRDDDSETNPGDGKIPIPPIPDLRYEQGILSSIRPFLHPVKSTPTAAARGNSEKEKHKLDLATSEQTALATAQLTLEGQAERRPGSTSDALMEPLRIEWAMVAYVLVRDQILSPLLQGVLWGMAGIYLDGLWKWNKHRLAAKNLAQPRRPTGPSLMSRLGLST
ncbi:uncharacterized protein JCM15063_003491 [Sporobolomyces koalae]|uniref:uncharacterized protein n=1 Tax=Sporobolomyces koalae TaxID=500713 RepID=UPI0031772ED3